MFGATHPYTTYLTQGNPVLGRAQVLYSEPRPEFNDHEHLPKAVRQKPSANGEADEG